MKKMGINSKNCSTGYINRSIMYFISINMYIFEISIECDIPLIQIYSYLILIYFYHKILHF